MEKFIQYENKGLSGLANLGNTCFINSCIQALINTYEFNEFLDNTNFQKKLSALRNPKFRFDSTLLIEYNNLRTMMFKENCSISPGAFIAITRLVAKEKKQEMFSGYDQNDLQEFLLFLLDSFHIALHRSVEIEIKGNIKNEEDNLAKDCYTMIKNMYSKEYSEIIKLFYGIHVSQICSLNDKSVLNNTPEPFFVLSLPIPEEIKNPSLYQCFQEHTKSEILKDENAWFNEKTNQKQDIEKKIIFWSLPQILIIHLKRFHFTGRKINKNIIVPLSLDLNDLVKNYEKSDNNYDLFAICNHMGNALGGHYTAYVKNANNKWYHCNDVQVQEFNINEDNINNNYSYCLFYRKKVVN